MLSPLLMIFLLLASNCLMTSTSSPGSLSSLIMLRFEPSSWTLLLRALPTAPSLGGRGLTVPSVLGDLCLSEDDLTKPAPEPLLITPGEGMGRTLAASSSSSGINLL